jgi:DNA-binding CsgD family transcriptional regulator
MQHYHGRLTPREREILKLLAAGYTSKQAAGALGIRIKTVETHRANMNRKLAASNLLELLKAGIKDGAITPSAVVS